MKINIEQVAQKAQPVIFVHKGEDENLIATVVDHNWLWRVYEAAIKSGFNDSYCPNQDVNSIFLPHSHICFDDNGVYVSE